MLLKFLREKFINLIGDDPKKHEYAHEVHSMIQKSYEKAGGIHGSGYKDPHDMVKNIPMWKIKKHQGKIVAAAMYKDKGGRKAVAIGTDGSDHGKSAAAEILKSEILRKRSFSEKSHSSLSFIKKHIGSDELKKHLIHRDEVHKHLPGEEIRHPPHDDSEVQRHPEFKDHFYQRKIGNEWHTKVMMGTPGKAIVKK